MHIDDKESKWNVERFRLTEEDKRMFHGGDDEDPIDMLQEEASEEIKREEEIAQREEFEEEMRRDEEMEERRSIEAEEELGDELYGAKDDGIDPEDREAFEHAMSKND